MDRKEKINDDSYVGAKLNVLLNLIENKLFFILIFINSKSNNKS